MAKKYAMGRKYEVEEKVVSEEIKQVGERAGCTNSYITLEHMEIIRNQSIINAKLDRILEILK